VYTVQLAIIVILYFSVRYYTKTSCDYQACTVLAILILLSFVTFADDFNDEEEVQSFGYKRFGKCIAVMNLQPVHD